MNTKKIILALALCIGSGLYAGDNNTNTKPSDADTIKRQKIQIELQENLIQSLIGVIDPSVDQERHPISPEEFRNMLQKKQGNKAVAHSKPQRLQNKWKKRPPYTSNKAHKTLMKNHRILQRYNQDLRTDNKQLKKQNSRLSKNIKNVRKQIEGTSRELAFADKTLEVLEVTN